MTKRLLRGDPDRPFLTDPVKIGELLKRLKPHTHEPLWFYKIRGTASPSEKALSRDYPTAENAEILKELGVAILSRADFFKGAVLVADMAARSIAAGGRPVCAEETGRDFPPQPLVANDGMGERKSKQNGDK
jgi:hypothetical protein